MAEAKQELRLTMRRTRDSVPAGDAERASTAASDHVLAVEAIRAAQIVALYAAFGSELNTEQLALALRSAGVVLAYPRIVGRNRLVFHRVDDLAELRPNRLGIPEPPETAPRVPVERIDAFIVPGLAFDAEGNRLGWGKGYYDSTLVASEAALRVGFAFECQVVEQVPAGPRDARMDLIITEAGVRTCNRRDT